MFENNLFPSNIMVDQISIPDLMYRANQNHYHHTGERLLLSVFRSGGYETDKIIVNYIRHNLVKEYNETIREIQEYFGYKTYLAYKVAVLKKIADVYPQFIRECNRQIDEALNKGIVKY